MSFEGATFVDAKVIKHGENRYTVQHGTDKNLMVEFYTEAIYQEAQSEREGRPIFKDVEMIRIRTPGLHGNTVERAVRLKDEPNTPSDPNRFPAQWNAFRSQKEQRPDGTPLEQWAALTKAQVLTFKAQNIHVVEQIATLPDNNLDVLGMGGRRLRDMANAYLERDKAQEALSVVLAERDHLRADFEAFKQSVLASRGVDNTDLAQQLADARKEIEALKAAATQASQPKKRGRKPKVKETETNGN